MLITNDPELLKRMSAARSSYTRSDWYLAFRFIVGIDNVFTMLDDKQHTKRRSQMHNGVSNQFFDIGFLANILHSTWVRRILL
jgi:hypothetical protein